MRFIRLLFLGLFLLLSPAWASRSFVAASSQAATSATGLITVRPCTVSFWVKLNSISGVPMYWSTLTALDVDSAYIIINAGVANQFILVDGARNVTNTTTVSTGNWIHVAAVFNGDSSRVLYVNGVAAIGAADTLTFDFTAAVKTGIGCWAKTVKTNFADCLMSDLAFYQAALSAAEIGALAARLSPLRVRPSQLHNSYSFVSDIMTSLIFPAGTDAFTNSGSTFSADSPRIYR